MSDNSKRTSGGLTFAGLLTIVFITLKLLHVITWSWWWVLAPVWGPAAVVMAIAVVVFVLALIGAICGDVPKTRG